LGVLLVSAHRSGVGKTSLIAALLTQMSAQGQRVAYYKPFSASPGNDADVSFISRTILVSSGGPSVPDSLPLPQSGSGDPLITESQAQTIRQSLSEIQSASDLVMIEAPDSVSPTGDAWSLASDLADLLEAPALLMFPYSNALDSQTVLNAAEPYSDHLAGIAINGVTSYRQRDVENGLLAQLRSTGKTVFGAVPEDRIMISVTVQQIAEQLGGRWVQDPVNTETYIDRLLLGGNIMDSGETYYGRYTNQAVIVRAERPDIQMASLMEETKCLVLTGGSDPTEYVKAEAMERDVPLISVTEGTMSIVESLSGLLDRATSHSQHKVDRFGGLMNENLDMTALSALLTTGH
jgi:BioD-like phosphotransacetylase family protein